MTNKLLKLPSQRQLVDRLLHQIEFSRPFIFLSGSAGSGRGTLCGALSSQLPDKVRVVNLIGSPTMKMADVRQLLLQQVVAKPLFNPQDALADSFFRMVEGKPACLLLLIERADELPTELPTELWALCRHNDTLPVPHQLAIVLTCSDVWCRTQVLPLKGRTLPALELEVPPLSPPEQRIFLYEKAKELKVPTAHLPKLKVEEILTAANGHPSTIMQLLENIVTNRRIRKHQVELGVKKIATVAIAMAAGLLALSYLPLFDNKSKDEPPSQTTTLPALPGGELATPGSSANPLGAASKGADGQSGLVQDWQPDTKTLPKAVEGGPITTDSVNYEGRRVVIADEVVEKLMTQPDVSGALPTAVANELAGGGSQAVATVPPQPQTASAAAKPTSNPAAPATKPVAAPVSKVVLTPAATLNQKSKNHYSIQLMGASETQTVDRFVAEHALAGRVWVYQTKFRGSPWYVVLLGDHADAAQAKAAIRKLSPALLKGQPWPKSFAQVQKELKQ